MHAADGVYHLRPAYENTGTIISDMYILDNLQLLLSWLILLVINMILYYHYH